MEKYEQNCDWIIVPLGKVKSRKAIISYELEIQINRAGWMAFVK